MFKAPPEITAEVFTRIPAHLRRPGKLSAERLAAGKGTPATDSYIEGPSFDLHGNLYLVDIAFGLIMRASPDGEVELLAEYDGEPNGLKIYRDGRIIVADHKNGLMLFDPSQTAPRPWIGRFRTETFKGLNDLFIASNGDIYFTDQGQTGMQDPSGRVYRLGADGKTLELLLTNVPSPNGIVVNSARTHLYVAATRDNAVWRGMLLPDGSVTRVGRFIQMSGGAGPDGMALDVEGNLYVAHAGMGAVWKFSHRGEPLLRINSCAGDMTTNIAFGGPDNRTLFITESQTGTVMMAKMDVPGIPMHSHS
jgi:Gluconolactonase